VNEYFALLLQNFRHCVCEVCMYTSNEYCSDITVLQSVPYFLIGYICQNGAKNVRICDQ